MPIPETFDVRLVRGRPLSPSVRELVFERVDEMPLAFEAGQWVSLVLPLAGGEVRRAYSIASAPDGSGFELAVTHVENGPGSTYLHRLAPGSILTAVGPQGFFTRPLDDAHPSLFVATGTGVAPFRSMIHAALRSRSPLPLWLLFGVRHEEDILYRGELEELARGEPRVRLVVTLSQPGPSWQGKRGYVQAHVKELWSELAAEGGTPHAYVCGLQRMVGAVRDILRKELGLERKQVHSERYD